MTDPTAELLAAMHSCGLEPPTPLEWRGEIVRFKLDAKDTNKSGWYVAYPDPPKSAAFGSWKSGLKQTWSSDEPLPDDYDADELRRAWAEKKAEREAEREAMWDAAAAECEAAWEAAEPASAEHPYLRSKGIDEPMGLRQDGETLLIPMKGIDLGNPLRSLQTIDAEGSKRFWTGSHVHATRTTLIDTSIRFDRSGTVYLCEGWATGWTIHHVTGLPVVVAFFADNLLPIAKYLRGSYPNADLIVAADNDRWSLYAKGSEQERPNPGVVLAHQAAEAAGAQVAVPEFANLAGHPSDFNDLWMREGEPAVVRWLDPEIADQARLTPQPEEPEQEPDPELEEEAESSPPSGTWFDTAPFRVLGYNRGTYFFLPKGTGQIVGMTPPKLDRASEMYTLAPHSWWESYFQHGNGISWKTVADAMIQAAHRTGVFEPDQLRGRGCWPEQTDDGEEGILLHLGDRLLPPKASRYVTPDEYISPTGYTYENQGRKKGPGRSVMPLEEARDLLDLYRSFLWAEPISGDLLAGWTTLAPVCGALPWRPHVWMVGERGSGKAQPHSSRVLTKYGWKLMGEVQAGDVVNTPDGLHGTVLDVFPQGEQDVYELTFADGRKARATADHLWKVRGGWSGWRIVRTMDMIDSLMIGHGIHIPLPGALELMRNEGVESSLETYARGILAGDRTLALRSIEEVGREECSCILIDHPDHLYITDDWVVTHNSTILRDLVVPCVSDLHLSVVGNTTEAGIRQSLGADAFPVIFDEAEEDETAGRRVQGVLALARQASSESDARTLKGTVHGNSLQFRMRSMFCFASIGGAVHQEADRSRVSMLQLKGASQVPAEDRAAHWRTIQPKMMAVDEDTGRRLLARTLRLLRSGVLLDTVETFRSEAGRILGDQRNGDQYGTLCAGAWLLMADEAPSSLEAREIIGGSDLQGYQEDQIPEGVKALQILMQQRERIETSNGISTMSIGELVAAAQGHETGKASTEEAKRVLGQLGFRLDVEDGAYYLLIANQSQWINKTLDGTIYSRGARNVLRSLPGVRAVETPIRFRPGYSARATSVPYAVIDDPQQVLAPNGTKPDR